MSNGTNTPAGWYADPNDATQLRWWDGTQWTDHRSPAAAHPYSAAQSAAAAQATSGATDAPAYSAAPYSADATTLKAPEGTDTNTVWIWLAIVLPFVPLLGLFTLDPVALTGIDPDTGMVDPMAQYGMLGSPGYLLSVVGGWVAAGLAIWFTYLDWKTLRDRGVPAPFHWAWNFFLLIAGSSIVYAIGRSVVVKRRTGGGTAPMWVAIALVVVAIVAVTWWIVAIMVAAFEQVSQVGFS